MKNSLKQLFRTPLKAVLFFLLMAACSLLLVFGSVMLAQSMRRIDAAEKQFTTIGTVTQKTSSTRNETITWNKYLGKPYTTKINEYNVVLGEDILNFDETGYINKPENRPYYQAYLPDIYDTGEDWSKESTAPATRFSSYIVEFTPIENCVASSPIEICIQRILLNNESIYDAYTREHNALKPNLEVGDVVQFCDYSVENPAPLETGKTYICTLAYNPIQIYEAYQPPYSTQYGAKDGVYLSPLKVRNGEEAAPMASRTWFYTLSDPPSPRVEEVTDDFYEEGRRGQDWLTWADMLGKYRNWFLVLPTNSLQLLPAFHGRQAYVQNGREISGEEFESGAAVCMLSSDFAIKNHLEPGDKISLPFYFSLYGYLPDAGNTYPIEGLPFPTYHLGYSPLDANMEPYEPFWEEEYEIVGTYQPISKESLKCGTTELARDMFIIPSKSVKASDENHIASYGPMNALTTSFQIPNGTIEEFDAKLRAAVPEVEQLNITYNDNGYTEVIATLNTARLTAFLLFAVGLLATLAIVILLLFFFIVKQKKRTAVERSLGMSKKQCRKSLIAGVIILTLAAAIVGSACGAVILNTMDSNDDITETTEFSTDYSLWAANKPAAEVKLDTADVIVTTSLYIAIPILLVLFVYLLALFLVERNLKSEPILLLSTKVE